MTAYAPELTFAIDRSEKMGARMDELLGRMKKRKDKLEKKVSAKEKAAASASVTATSTKSQSK